MKAFVLILAAILKGFIGLGGQNHIRGQSKDGLRGSSVEIGKFITGA